MNKCKPILMLIASCTALSFLGCATPESYERMPQRDKDAWARCAGKVIEARLLPLGEVSMLARQSIGRELMIEYSETPKHSRKRWLKRNGCPPYMVD